MCVCVIEKKLLFVIAQSGLSSLRCLLTATAVRFAQLVKLDAQRHADLVGMALVELLDLLEAQIEFGEFVGSGQGGHLDLAFAVLVFVEFTQRTGGVDVEFEQSLQAMVRVDAIAILRWKLSCG